LEHYGRRPLMFEHAPVTAGEKGTCCVDHAHLNVFPVAVDVHEHLRRFPHARIDEMRELAARKEWNRPYLFLQTNDGRRFVYDAGIVPSQYIRKIVTTELAMPERWHWREYLGLEELKRTVAALSGWSRPSNVYGMEPSRAEDYDAMCLKMIRDRWDQKAFRWDADVADEHFHLNEDDSYSRFLDVADVEVTRRAQFCRERLLVDLGCATGLVLAHFVGRFAEGLGVDLSSRMLSIAAQRRLPRTRLVEANCFELSRHVSGAGAVLSRGVLLSHYGRCWAGPLLTQVRQALLPGGGFAMLDFLNAAAQRRYPGNPNNKTYYEAAEIESLAKQAGFQRVAILGEPERRVLLLLAECST
jgi:SAM-dependent methyltransferase